MSVNTKHKLLAFLLVVSIALPFSSCAVTPPKEIVPNTAEIIPDDAPWYNSEIINVDLNVDASRAIESLSPHLIGSDDKYICVFVDGWYQVADWSKIEANSDYMFKNLVLVDRTTKQTYKTIDLFSILDTSCYPENVTYTSGRILVKGSCWNSQTNDYYGEYYYIDPESESIVDTIEYDYEANMQALRSFEVGEYTIETSYNPMATPMCCCLKVFAPDGTITDIEISDTQISYYEVPIILAVDDKTALIPVAISGGYSFFELDLDSYEYSECEADDYDWLDLDLLLHPYCNAEGEVFYTDSNGISKIDLQNESNEQVLDYSWCGASQLYITDPEIVECSEDSIVLCGQYDGTDIFSSPFVKKYAIVELTKAEKNPHAGKKIMELFVADGNVDTTIADAVIEFNDSNSEYYIEISERYVFNNYMNYNGIDNQDEFDSEWFEASASLSDELAIDIINGDGPDIIMNASALGQLNSDSCLVDLSPYLTDLDEAKYFTNIIEGAKNDGKLYQLPVSITIEGIQTDPQYAGASGVGFTTDEYDQFLDDTLNGTDVIESGQAMYFVKLFNGMNDVFIKDGKVDLNVPEYAELADFVKDNVCEESESWFSVPEDTSPEEYNMGKNWETAYYCNCPSISGYLVKRAQITNGTAILGIPSTDGRGPMFGASASVAVSAYAVNVDACVDFVKILLSEDIQTELAYSDKIVLDRDVLRQVCGEAIEYFNTEQGSQSVYDYAQGTNVTIIPNLTNDDVDNLENVIVSCTKMNLSDAAISIILAEEMPAYFLDQKDLDAVVEIVQDRAQTVLDERG